MLGFFDRMFDLNHDGKLNLFERGLKYATYERLMEEAKERDSLNSYSSVTGGGGYSDSPMLDEGQIEMLKEAGVDEFELSFMSDEEREEAIQEAGLDPYDFL